MKNMKMNKWTMGLAAAGVVTLSSVAQAQDAAAGAEALAASTTLSGYVSTGYKFNKASNGVGYFRAGEGRNAFSLDVVDLKLSSAQGDGAMDSGYTVELWMGPAASDIDTNDAASSDENSLALMQANIDLRWNDIDLKIGQFGTVVGNEVYNYNENALYTHSWGFALEPTHHTGILASYTVNDDLSVSFGIANDTGNQTNGAVDGGNNSSKAYLGAISYTLGSGTGAAAGTELYYGLVTGNTPGVSGDNTEFHYSSIKLPELVTDLSTKITWDHVQHGEGVKNKDSNVVGLYLGYKINDTTTLNIRGEMGNMNTAANETVGSETARSLGTANGDNLRSITVGVNHKIWDNVISRIEYRHDEVDVDGTVDDQQEVIALNIIYTF